MQLLKENARNGYLKLTSKQGFETFTIEVHMTNLLIDVDLASMDLQVVVQWLLPIEPIGKTKNKVFLCFWGFSFFYSTKDYCHN